jgi:putative ABC transport system permease protein
LGSIARALESEHGGTNKEVRADLVSLRDAETKRLRPYAVLLAGAVGLVLLVACANVANLMLARASAREKELAVRAAFGAGRFRLLRLALLEASVLGLAGGIAGVLLSWGALRLLEQAVPVELPVWMAFRIDGRILAFGLLVTLAASLGFGIVPAREVLRSNLSESIRQGGRGGTARSAGLRRALITLEVGLALVLVAGAFQLLSGLLRLGRVDPGLTPEKLVVFYVSPPGDKYRRTERLPAYADLYRRVIDRVRDVPGVAGVAGANAIPNDGEASEPTGIGLTLEGQTPEDQRRNPTAVMVRVSPGYFEVAGIPRLQGRDFRENEDLTAPLTAIVSASAARRFWPGQNPLGRRLKTGLPGDDAPWAEVIGVVGDVRYHGLDQSDDIAVYYSYNQRTAGDLHFAVRAQGSAEAILDTVRRTIAEVDPQVAVYNARTMGTVLANSTWRERLSSHVLGAYAASALALAAVGIYGVISYLVSRRAAEMGIRMAVGATRVDIVKLVQSEVAKLLLLGCVLGLAGAAVLTRAIEGLVFGAEALDLASFLLAPATVVAAGLAAGLLPALRASRTSPLRVLGWE